MAHSRPVGIDNRGDAHRTTIVAGYFIGELCGDPRVNALYAQWRTAREQGRLALDLALSQSYANPDTAAKVLEESLIRYDANELAATQRFVRDELKLSYTWVAPCLLHAFRIRVHNERHPHDEQEFAVPVYVLPEYAKGKGPAREGADLKRNVTWYYRHAVRKGPSDSNRALIREYAAVAKRDEEYCWSVVQNTLKQVRLFLDLIERRYIIEKPGYVVTREGSALPLK